MSAALRSSAARQTLKLGFLPCDGIGKEVLPASQHVLSALGDSIPKVEVVPLLAGWECFTNTGVALPEETIRWVCCVYRSLRQGGRFGQTQ
jgi:homoisocitrate dehydrogenase